MSRAKESSQGQVHLLADAALTRFRVATTGSDADHVKAPALATDVPLGLVSEGCEAAEQAVAVRLCGYGETFVAKAAGVIAAGALFCPSVDGTGTIRALPSSGSVYVMGRALELSADGQEIAVQTFAPFLFDCGVGAPASKLAALVEAVALADMTDGTGTSGYKDLTAKLPIGAYVLGGKAVVATGFAGDTTAAIQVGVSGNVDAFLDGDPSVLTPATVWGPPDGIHLLTALTTVRVTVTGAADFTSITAGAVTVYIFYLDLAA